MTTSPSTRTGDDEIPCMLRKGARGVLHSAPPPRSNPRRPMSGKNAITRSPSQAGVGVEGPFMPLATSLRDFVALRRQRVSPVAARRQRTILSSPSSPVRKRRPPSTIGDDRPGGTAAFQERVFSREHSDGSRPAPTPDPFGPRKRGHSPSGPAERAARRIAAERWMDSMATT